MKPCYLQLVIVSITGLYVPTRIVHGALTSTLTNKRITVSQGHSAMFDCQTDSPSKIRWKRFQPGNPTAELIADGNVMNPDFSLRFSVQFSNVTGRSVLRIGNVLTSDTGSYRCSEQLTVHNELKFELIAVDKSSGELQPGETADISADRGNIRQTSTSTSSTLLIAVVVGLVGFCLLLFAALLAVCIRRHNSDSPPSAQEQSDKVTYSRASVRAAISLPDTALNTNNIPADGYSLAAASHRPSPAASGTNIYHVYHQISDDYQPTDDASGDAVMNQYDGLDQDDVAATRAAQLSSVYIPINRQPAQAGRIGQL